MRNFVKNSVTVVLLGALQDGGLPHAGCRCRRCALAYDDPSRAGLATCLAVVDTRQAPAAVWLIDATPDIKHQLNLLAPALGPHPTRPARLRPPDGLFLTHAHLGHIGGLPQLGPEAMAVEGLPVYATPALLELLRATRLWSPLVDRLDLRPLTPGTAVSLAPELTLTPLAVPHRDEWNVGTLAFVVTGPRRSLLYLPDIDSWMAWPAARRWVTAVDIAILDATFYSTDELGGRAPVAHPLIPDTLARFAGGPGELVLTHFNHTNPVLEADSAAADFVRAAGVRLAHTGMRWKLSRPA